MIAFFRKYLGSKIALALFALIALAFLITGFGTEGTGGMGNLALGKENIASVGGVSITTAEAEARIQNILDNERQQRPGFTMADFDKAGGIDDTINNMIDTQAILAFAKKHQIVISRRLIDREIGKISQLKTATGKFDADNYAAVLAQNGMTDTMLREQITVRLINEQLEPALKLGAKPSQAVVDTYASLQLERRFGQFAEISSARFMGGAPTEAEIKAYYDRNLVKYTEPERRSVRYAFFDRSALEDKVSASEEDIAAAFQKDATKYAASEKRVFTQVVVADQAGAKAIAEKVRGGTSIEVAAKAAGLASAALDGQDKKEFGAVSSAAVADAAFAAAQGSIIEPAKSGLGWHVVRVDKIERIGAKSLADVRGTLSTEISKRKVDEALANMVERIEDAISDGKTMDDVAKTEGLTIETTALLDAAGNPAGTTGAKLSPEMSLILKDAFQSEIDDDPTVVTIGADNRHAIVKIEKINASAATPLESIKSNVTADTQTDKAVRAARKLATELVAKINAGTAMGAAFAAQKLGAPSQVSALRIQVKQADNGVGPLAALFKLTVKKARMAESADGKSFGVVWLDRIEPGKASSEPQLITATQSALAQALPLEYREQLTSAMKADVGLLRNAATIAALKRRLLGQTGTK